MAEVFALIKVDPSLTSIPWFRRFKETEVVTGPCWSLDTVGYHLFKRSVR